MEYNYYLQMHKCIRSVTDRASGDGVHIISLLLMLLLLLMMMMVIMVIVMMVMRSSHISSNSGPCRGRNDPSLL